MVLKEPCLDPNDSYLVCLDHEYREPFRNRRRFRAVGEHFGVVNQKDLGQPIKFSGACKRRP